MIRRSALIASMTVVMVTSIVVPTITAASDVSVRPVPSISSPDAKRKSGVADGRAGITVIPVADRNQQVIGVPKLDISSTCRAASNLQLSDGENYDSCMQDERKTRDQLVKNWTRYSREIRARCTAEATNGGNPSYVDLFECSEMANWASQLNSKGDMPNTIPSQTKGAINSKGQEPGTEK
jgi:hypothetical protein